MEDILPISGTDWEIVSDRHATYYPDKGRTGLQLKKKFFKMAHSLIPTGNPNIPDDIRSAKRILRLIVDKSDGDTGSRDDDVLAREDEEDAQGEESSTFNTPRRRGATPITRGRRGGRHGTEDDGPSFGDIFQLISDQQQHEIELRAQERAEQREERQERLEEQREERRAQLQMQMQMMQSNQQMMSAMMMMIGGRNGASVPSIPHVGRDVTIDEPSRTDDSLN